MCRLHECRAPTPTISLPSSLSPGNAGFTRAAARFGVSESALSHAIRALEKTRSGNTSPTAA
jgi:hypothetical protein